ncbi:hypothetical protein [Thermoflexus sp.]|uniref:hypothetical protein n=1 Tax=Thermoflexus sp. TaxID=1969742 RepID=UPI0035E40783
MIRRDGEDGGGDAGVGSGASDPHADGVTEKEEIALKRRQRLGQLEGEFLTKRPEAVRPVPGPVGSKWEQAMRYPWKGEMDGRASGDGAGVRFLRRRSEGDFPLDRPLGWKERPWREGMGKEAVRLRARMP